MNLKQTLFLSAGKAAGEVPQDLKPAEYAKAMRDAFDGQKFDPKDYEFWRHIFVEARGRLGALKDSKAISELAGKSTDPMSADKAPIPVTESAPVAAAA